MMNRNAEMEALGVFNGQWRKVILPIVASNIGGNPVMRELLMRHWIVEMKAVALKTPENASFDEFHDLLKFESGDSDGSR